ncbi:hypothetical protein ABKV19_007321 [Rosa sericea]
MMKLVLLPGGMLICQLLNLYPTSFHIAYNSLTELLERNAVQLTICYCRCSHKKSLKEPLVFLH